MNINNLGNLNNVASMSNSSNVSQAQFTDESAKLESFQEKLLVAQDDAELKEACDQFEEYFLNLMFKSMQKTINKDDSENSMFKESQAEKITKDFLYQEYAKSMTDAGGIGLSTQMYEQMKRQNDAKEVTEAMLSNE